MGLIANGQAAVDHRLLAGAGADPGGVPADLAELRPAAQMALGEL